MGREKKRKRGEKRGEFGIRRLLSLKITDGKENILPRPYFQIWPFDLCAN